MDGSKIKGIQNRLDNLRALEDAGRGAVALAGMNSEKWPLGNAILATIADTLELCAEAARSAGPSLEGAVVGFLRAAGYRVEEPGTPSDDSDARVAPYAIGETVDFRFVDVDGGLRIRAVVEVGCHSTTAFDAQEELLAMHPMRPGTKIQFAESSTAEDRPHGPLPPSVAAAIGPAMCTNCGSALLVDGRCRYSDCNPAVVPGADVPSATDQTLALRLPGVVNGGPVTPATLEAPAAKAGRAAETKIPANEWAPTEKDLGEMAALVGCSVGRAAALVETFRKAKAGDPPQARWRVPFIPWAKAQPKEVSACST